MRKMFALICKKCGNIMGHSRASDHVCYICGQKLEPLFDVDWELIYNLPIEELDKYRFQFQPKSAYDRMAYLHREHMDITFAQS